MEVSTTNNTFRPAEAAKLKVVSSPLKFEISSVVEIEIEIQIEIGIT
jgi:hypothetical protein